MNEFVLTVLQPFKICLSLGGLPSSVHWKRRRVLFLTKSELILTKKEKENCHTLAASLYHNKVLH